MVGAPERPQYWYSNEPRANTRCTAHGPQTSLLHCKPVCSSPINSVAESSATAWLVVAAKMPAPPTWAVEATADRAVPKTDEPRPPTKKIEFAPAFAADRFDALQAERDDGAVELRLRRGLRRQQVGHRLRQHLCEHRLGLRQADETRSDEPDERLVAAAELARRSRVDRVGFEFAGIGEAGEVGRIGEVQRIGAKDAVGHLPIAKPGLHDRSTSRRRGLPEARRSCSLDRRCCC